MKRTHLQIDFDTAVIGKKAPMPLKVVFDSLREVMEEKGFEATDLLHFVYPDELSEDELKSIINDLKLEFEWLPESITSCVSFCEDETEEIKL